MQEKFLETSVLWKKPPEDCISVLEFLLDTELCLHKSVPHTATESMTGEPEANNAQLIYKVRRQ